MWSLVVLCVGYNWVVATTSVQGFSNQKACQSAGMTIEKSFSNNNNTDVYRKCDGVVYSCVSMK